MMREMTGLAALVLLCLVPAPSAAADGPLAPFQEQVEQIEQLDMSARTGPVVPHPEAQEAIGRLKSPFCPGLMLEVCPSPQAGALRDTLQLMAEQGADADSLVAWMLARHGEEYRAVPQTEGGGLLAWVVPPLALVLGGGLVVLVLGRIRRQGDGRIDADAVRSLTVEDEERLAAALSQMEREGL